MVGINAKAIIERRGGRYHPAVRWNLDRHWNHKKNRPDARNFHQSLLKGHAYRLTQRQAFVYGRSTRWRWMSRLKAAAITLRHHYRFWRLRRGKAGDGYVNAWRSRAPSAENESAHRARTEACHATKGGGDDGR